MSKMVLASGSPRREELLKRLNLRFTIVPSKIEEDQFHGLPPVKMVMELARAKAEEVAELVEDTIVIAADTVVEHNGKLLGKPVNKEDAEVMLKKLQGDRHKVITGLAVLSTDEGKTYVEHDQTDVYMRPIEDEEIKRYINTGEPMDKAGSYGIQGLGGMFVEKINGSYFTVMGLPNHKLVLILKKFSIDIVK